MAPQKKTETGTDEQPAGTEEQTPTDPAEPSTPDTPDAATQPPADPADVPEETPAVELRAVRMLVKISGTRDGIDWPNAGQETELPATEAADLIQAGYAASAEAPETATAPTADVETATPQGNRSIKARTTEGDGGN